jgi:beta-alanine--pyruvate transaminase
MHGYTYSAHPLACAAAVATQKLYADTGLFERAAAVAQSFEDALHSLKGAPHVIDVRNLGLVGGIELAPRAGAPGRRAYEAMVRCVEAGVLIRVTGETIALSPPLIIEEAQIAQIVDTIRSVLGTLE